MEILKSLPLSRITRLHSLSPLSQLRLTILCRNQATCRIILCRSLKNLRRRPTNPGSKRDGEKERQRDGEKEGYRKRGSLRLSVSPSLRLFNRAIRYKKAASEFRGRRFSQGVKVNLEAYNYDCNSLPGLNRMVFPSGMATCVPVRGLRPMPRLRGLTTKTPKPRSSMRSPRFIASFMASKRASTATSAFIFGTPVFSATLLMMSSLITDSPTQEASIQFDFESVSICLLVFKGMQKKHGAL
jgi:hypothetical protein